MKRIFRRSDDRKDVTDELRFHIDMRTQEFIDSGMSAEEARAGSMGDWLFVGGIIVLLVALGLASAVVSIYLLTKLFTGFT